MRTQPHWDECLAEIAYVEANSIALQLKEYAKLNRYDCKGIKVLNKQQIFDKGGRSNAQIVWTEGPEDWAYTTEPTVISSVYTEAHDGQTLSFYNK